jgi:hypothetical protein
MAASKICKENNGVSENENSNGVAALANQYPSMSWHNGVIIKQWREMKIMKRK